MDNTLLQNLSQAKDAGEKAAIVAEYLLSDFPEPLAAIVRQCVLLHWFDRPLLEVFFQEFAIPQDQREQDYQRIIALPFVEKLPWGHRIQNLTRVALLQIYETTQPKLLKNAARIAGSVYETRKEKRDVLAEALFCFIVGGDKQKGVILLHTLQEQALARGDWQYLENLLRRQDEAKQISFVEPLPLAEEDWLVRGGVHRRQGNFDAAYNDFDTVIKSNPRNIDAYIGRGATNTEQQRYKQALADYQRVLKIDAKNTSAYMGRGIAYSKQGRNEEALQNFDIVTGLDPTDATALYYKARVLNELGREEEALPVYNQARVLNPTSTRIMYGQAEALHLLGRNEEAKDIYQELVDLDPDNREICKAYGQVLIDLEKYAAALDLYEEVLLDNPDDIEAYQGKGRALRGLGRYEQASLAYEEANRLEELKTSATQSQKQEFDEDKSIHRQQNRETSSKVLSISKYRNTTASSSRSIPKRSSTRFSTLHRTIEIGFSIAAVLILVFASLILFHRYIINTETGGIDIISSGDATATAIVQANDNANATATTQVIDANPDPYISGSTLNFVDSLEISYKWKAEYNSSGSRCRFTDNGFEIDQQGPSIFLDCDTSETFSNFAFEVTMTINSGDCGGIILRENSSMTEFYLFEVCQDGSYYFKKYLSSSGSDAITLANGTYSQFAPSNKIAVVAEGNNFFLYINYDSHSNNQPVDTLSDRDYSEGYIGLIAVASTHSTSVTYTNARVWTIGK